jgi:hypothetical protein
VIGLYNGDCVLCAVRAEPEETTEDLKITTETAFCEVRAEDEATVDDPNTKFA